MLRKHLDARGKPLSPGTFMRENILMPQKKFPCQKLSLARNMSFGIGHVTLQIWMPECQVWIYIDKQLALPNTVFRLQCLAF